MSVPVLERSVLERKERDELQTIARALGIKPPARAKKADIVDLILTSAGITTSAPTPEPEPEPEPEPPVAAEPDVAAPVEKHDDASVTEPVEHDAGDNHNRNGNDRDLHDRDAPDREATDQNGRDRDTHDRDGGHDRDAHDREG